VKLYITERPAPRIAGGKAILLVDEQGIMIPCQQAVTITQETDEMTTCTVTFIVNGKDVLIGDPLAGTVLLDKGERSGL